MRETPVALTIAGSDSSSGAGIQADLKAFMAAGVYGVNAITGVVAETPGMVSRILPVPSRMVVAQARLLLRSFPVRAVKTGLLCTATTVQAIARLWRSEQTADLLLVIDPVMVATSGDALLEPDAIAAYERQLFTHATLITPNLDEAGRLLGEPITKLEEMRRAVRALAEKYRAAVLLKGGHLRGERAVDLLYQRKRLIEISAAYFPNVQTHGTGCTYSAAITAELARGSDLESAVRRAKRIVTSAIRRHFTWKTKRSEIHALNLPIQRRQQPSVP